MNHDNVCRPWKRGIQISSLYLSVFFIVVQINFYGFIIFIDFHTCKYDWKYLLRTIKTYFKTGKIFLFIIDADVKSKLAYTNIGISLKKWNVFLCTCIILYRSKKCVLHEKSCFISFQYKFFSPTLTMNVQCCGGTCKALCVRPRKR